MNKIKRLFLNILQGNVIYDNNIVPVIIKDYWFDTTPCITIHGNVRNKTPNNRHYVQVKRVLDKNHDLYDSEKPFKKYPHLAESITYSYDVQINVWCNNEREREIIVNKVKECLFLARNNHYTYCSKYDNETCKCKTLDEECRARTTYGYRQLRGLCPSPKEYGCCSLLNAYGVIKSSISISPDYEQDEYNHKPPLKRSIIDIELDYKDIIVFPSNPNLCYEIPKFNEEGVSDNINDLVEEYEDNG